MFITDLNELYHDFTFDFSLNLGFIIINNCAPVPVSTSVIGNVCDMTDVLGIKEITVARIVNKKAKAVTVPSDLSVCYDATALMAGSR